MNNNLQTLKKHQRNSSSSYFNTNIGSDYIQFTNINYPDSNNEQINPNYVNQSIYPGNLLNNDVDDLVQCPNCLSYQQKLKEKNLIIQKLQNQISRLNSSISSNSTNILPNMNLNDLNNQNNRQISILKKNISDLKLEISKKNEEFSQMCINYDEQLNHFLSKNNQLEQELSNVKRSNILINKSNIKLNKLITFKDDEIGKYKEKMQALLNTIASKNNDINKLKEDSKNKMEDLENKYMNLSSNYNTLALSSGGGQLIKYTQQKSKSNSDSDFSNEEDNLAEILYNTGKLAKKESNNNNNDILKSKSQNLYYESGSENKVKNLNKQKSIKNDRISTPKMSSTQSSWMISKKPNEIHIFQRDFENIKKKLDIAIKENKKLMIKNEQLKKLFEQNNSMNNNININDLILKYNSLKKLLDQKTNEIIKYQRDIIEKKNQIEKLKSLLLSKTNNSSNKIPCPSTISSTKRHESNKLLYQKNKLSSNKVRVFSEYDRDVDTLTDEPCGSNKLSSYKGNSQDLIDISDKEEMEKKKLNKSNSCKKNNLYNLKSDLTAKKNISSDSNKEKDIQINLLNQKINELYKKINSYKSQINELQNIYKSMDEIKLSKEELENKLKIINKENNEVSKKLETKNKLINEYEIKINYTKKTIEEKNTIIQQNEKDILNAQKENQDFEKIISQMEKSLLSSENMNREQEKNINEKNNIIKEKENNIILLEKKIDNLNEIINKSK